PGNDPVPSTIASDCAGVALGVLAACWAGAGEGRAHPAASAAASRTGCHFVIIVGLRAFRDMSPRPRHGHAGIALDHWPHRTIRVVLQMLDGDGPSADRPVELADRQRGVVQEQVPVALELHDPGMDREAVLARPGELASVGPRSLD